MMKRILLCLIGFMMLQAVPAKRMRDYFADMPDSILYVMTRNNRLDCIDFIENNMQARVRNRFDAFSELMLIPQCSASSFRLIRAFPCCVRKRIACTSGSGLCLEYN